MQVFRGKYRGQPAAFKVVANDSLTPTETFHKRVLLHECRLVADIKHEYARLLLHQQRPSSTHGRAHDDEYMSLVFYLALLDVYIPCML
jgi:hypothetical protein